MLVSKCCSAKPSIATGYEVRCTSCKMPCETIERKEDDSVKPLKLSGNMITIPINKEGDCEVQEDDRTEISQTSEKVGAQDLQQACTEARIRVSKMSREERQELEKRGRAIIAQGSVSDTPETDKIQKPSVIESLRSKSIAIATNGSTVIVWPENNHIIYFVDELVQHARTLERERDALKLTLAKREVLIEIYGKMVDKLLGHCPITECMECSKIVCPFEELLHLHHDGCPHCYRFESKEDYFNAWLKQYQQLTQKEKKV